MAADVTININAQDNFSGVLGNFGNIMTGISSAVHLAGDALRAFTGFAMEGLDAIASYERIGAALDTLVAVQLVQNGVAKDMAAAYKVSGDEAEKLLQWVQEIAIKSPFTQEGVAQALRMAMAYGFNVDEAKRLTQALIDFAAGSGASEDAMGRIALALGQIEAKGKLSGQEVLQLVNAGLPVTQILAEAFGVTTAELVKMQEKGLIPAKDAIQAITEYLETNFAGAAERQSLTWAGLLGTFEDLKAMGLREFFGGLFDAIQPMTVALADWLQGSGMELIKEWGASLGEFATNGINGLRLLIGTFYEMQDVFEQGGIGGVLDSLLGDAIDAQKIVEWLDQLDAALAVAVATKDWTASGDAFGDGLMAALGASVEGLESQDSALIPAIANAINDWFLGATGMVDWSQFWNTLEVSGTNGMRLFWNQMEVNGTDAVRNFFDGMEVSITDAVRGWFDGMEVNATDWVRDHIVDPIKAALGIASPSTVFMQIGRDIVGGLIGGLGSMAGSLLAVMDAIITAILAPLAPVLDLLGIDVSGSGSTGSHTTTPTIPGSPTSPTGGGTSITQNFAGATINVGSWDEISYDCIYPNPFIAATGGQLGVSSGGGTGAPR